jgi:hypothetical protein
MEEAPENGKESSNSAHANEMNEYINAEINNKEYPQIHFELKYFIYKGNFNM